MLQWAAEAVSVFLELRWLGRDNELTRDSVTFMSVEGNHEFYLVQAWLGPH